MKVNNIRVTCRFRPLNKKEQNYPEIVKLVSTNTSLTIQKQEDKKKLPFTFDQIFYEESTQEQVYNYCAKPLVDAVITGFNGTILAYGQTSSGKTHSMLGTNQDPGIIPRMLNSLFDHIEQESDNIEFSIKASMMEIYCEKIRDLIDPANIDLKIRENKVQGVYVQDLFQCPIQDEEELSVILSKGFENRTTGTTHMNHLSSRSHLIFLLEIKQKDNLDMSTKSSKMCMIDLAGSEKAKKTGADGVQLEEAKKINQSLLTLKNVINSLAHGNTFVPFRDSKLTRICADSLGGNSKTTLIICASPSQYNESETISTMRFGEMAQVIKNTPKINIEMTVEQLTHLLAKAEQKILVLTKQNEYYLKLLKDNNIKVDSQFNSNNDKTNEDNTDKTNEDNSILQQQFKEQKVIDDEKINKYQQQINSFQNEINRKNENLKNFNKKFLNIKNLAATQYNEIRLLNQQNHELIEKLAVSTVKLEQESNSNQISQIKIKSQEEKIKVQEGREEELRKEADRLRQEKGKLTSLVEEQQQTLEQKDQSQEYMLTLGKDMLTQQYKQQSESYQQQYNQLQNKYDQLHAIYEQVTAEKYPLFKDFKQMVVEQLVTEHHDLNDKEEEEWKQLQEQRGQLLSTLEQRVSQLDNLLPTIQIDKQQQASLRSSLLQSTRQIDTFKAKLSNYQMLNTNLLIAQKALEAKFTQQANQIQSLQQRVQSLSTVNQTQAIKLEHLEVEARNHVPSSTQQDMDSSQLIANMASINNNNNNNNNNNVNLWSLQKSGNLMFDNLRKTKNRGVYQNKKLNMSLFGNFNNHSSVVPGVMSNRFNTKAIIEEDMGYDASQTYSSQKIQQNTAEKPQIKQY